MNTLERNNLRKWIVAAAVMAMFASFEAVAKHESEPFQDAQLIYQNQSINHSIFSYLSRLAGETVPAPEIVYVNRGYGQAIYGYDHVGQDKIAPLIIGYVNKAFNPAINSYWSSIPAGSVEMFPVELVH